MSWVTHVIVDAALGIGLLIAGVHGHGDDYLTLDLAGAYLLAVTLVTDAPGGMLKVVPRLVHRLTDALVAIGLLASPLISWHFGVRLDLFASVMAEAVGVILGRDALVSQHRKRRAATDLPPPIEATAVEHTGGSETVFAASRQAGVVAGKLRRRASDADVAGAVSATARRAGSLAGWARRRAQNSGGRPTST